MKKTHMRTRRDETKATKRPTIVPLPKTGFRPPSPSMSDHGSRSWLAIQRSLGNRAVQGFLGLRTTHVIQRDSIGSTSIEFTDEEALDLRPDMLDERAIQSAIGYNRRRGYSSSLIEEIQRAVGTRDDGTIGSETVQAVARWQASHGLTPDGKVGPTSLATLSKEFPAPAAKVAGGGHKGPPAEKKRAAPAAARHTESVTSIIGGLSSPTLQELNRRIVELVELQATSEGERPDTPYKVWKRWRRLRKTGRHWHYREAQPADAEEIVTKVREVRRLINSLAAGEIGVTVEQLERIQGYYYRRVSECTPYFTQMASTPVVWKDETVVEDGKKKVKGPWSSLCGLTSLSMVLHALGVTADDFVGPPGSRKVLQQIAAQFAPPGKAFSDLEARFPDFLQLVVIYTYYKEAGGSLPYDAKLAKQARGLSGRKARKGGVGNLNRILSVAKRFGVTSVAKGSVESYGLQKRRLKKGLERKKITEEQFDAGKKRLDGEKESLLAAYKQQVLEEVLPELDRGGQVLLARPKHYVRLQGFYEKGIVIDDPAWLGKNYKMKWGRASREGFFSAYRVLSR